MPMTSTGVAATCPCMTIQQPDGSEACRQCRGDFYACECPLRHSIRCENHPDRIHATETQRVPSYSRR